MGNNSIIAPVFEFINMAKGGEGNAWPVITKIRTYTCNGGVRCAYVSCYFKNSNNNNNIT